MKIIFLSREYPPDTLWGGEAKACEDMARIMASFGHDVHVICQSVNGGKGSIKSDEHGVIIHRVGTDPRTGNVQGLLNYVTYAIREVLKITSKPGSFVIHGFYGGTDIFAYSLIKKLGFRKYPFVMHAHGSVRDDITNKKNQGWLRYNLLLRFQVWSSDFTARRSNRVIVISQSLQTELHDQSRVPMSKMQLVLIPKNPEKYKFTPSNLRNDLQIDGESKIILFVGRLEERKGVKFLSSAIPLIQAKYPKTVFVFVGKDTPTSPIKGFSYKQYIVDTFLKQNLGSIRFISDVNDEFLVKAYSIADVVVSPSLHETSTSVPIEAMACGKPVVITDTGNARIMGIDGTNGSIVPTRNSELLAEAIINMLGLTETQRLEISKRNREIIQSIFSFSSWIEELRSISGEWELRLKNN